MKCIIDPRLTHYVAFLLGKEESILKTLYFFSDFPKQKSDQFLKSSKYRFINRLKKEDNDGITLQRFSLRD